MATNTFLIPVLDKAIDELTGILKTNELVVESYKSHPDVITRKTQMDKGDFDINVPQA